VEQQGPEVENPRLFRGGLQKSDKKRGERGGKKKSRKITWEACPTGNGIGKAHVKKSRAWGHREKNSETPESTIKARR